MSGPSPRTWPSVTVVFLAFNRRDELRLSLWKTLEDLDYDRDRLDIIVVDNASTDGTVDMVRREFPSVELIERSWNRGVSGWNDGFARSTGEYVLALDDDCYLQPDGLRRAIAEAERERADLVSFGVRSGVMDDWRFDVQEYRTGLLAFWGCAVLVRREALEALGGYDPEIFLWANELEFLVRFYDHGFRHLHLPEVVAVHGKAPLLPGHPFPERAYRFNSRHFAYVTGKLLRARDAAAVFPALLGWNLFHAYRHGRPGLRGVRDTVEGFLHGLRRRRPVRPALSRLYRHNFLNFANPLSVYRPLWQAALDAVRSRGDPELVLRRRDQWLASRERYYPRERGVLRV
jgi:GT2 family glycosyltransferase